MKVDWLFFSFLLLSEFPFFFNRGFDMERCYSLPICIGMINGVSFHLSFPSAFAFFFSAEGIYGGGCCSGRYIRYILGIYIIYGAGCSFLICIRLRINVHFRGNFRRIQTLPDSFQLFNMRGPFVLSHPVPPWSRLDFRNYETVAKPAKNYRFWCHQ